MRSLHFEALEGRLLLSLTPQLLDVFSSNGSSAPANLTTVNGTLFFSAVDRYNGRELWKSDGTEAGTVLVKDIHSLSNYGSNPAYLTNVNGTLFFAPNGLLHPDFIGANIELWKCDGTTEGTIPVGDTNFPASLSFFPRNLTNVNGTLFYTAVDFQNVRQL